MRVQPREIDPVEEERTTSPWRTVALSALVLLVGLQYGWGLVVMIVSLVVMIFMHELGHYLTAKWAGMKVTEFFIGFGPRIWSFQRGETEYGLKAIPAGAYVKIIGMSNLEEIDPSEEERTYRAKSYGRRMSVAVAGSTMHFLMAFVLIFVILVGFGFPQPERWRVADVSEDSPAQGAGLQPGDRIAAVDGRRFKSFGAMSEHLRANPGETVELLIVRDGNERTIDVTLADRHPETDEEVGFLGIGPITPFERVGPVDGVVDGIKEFGTVTKASIVGLGRIFSPSGVEGYVDTIVKASDDRDATISEDRPTSIVGIANIGNQVSKEGYVNVLYLMFGVNIFIGIFNLFPMLPFDGGHVLIATYEKIRELRSGRRYQADVAKLLPFTYAVVLVLALLFVTSIYLDIADPIEL